MRFVIFEALARKISAPADFSFDGTKHELCAGFLRPLPAWSGLRLQGRSGIHVRTNGTLSVHRGTVTRMNKAPKLAVFKFASCDGCQLSLLDCEDELLAVAEAVEIAYFLEARTQSAGRPVRRRTGRRLDHHGTRRRANSGDSATMPLPGHDRRLCHVGRHSSPAELGRRRRFHWPGLRAPGLHRHARTRAPRLPITSSSTLNCAAARSTRCNWWS